MISLLLLALLVLTAVVGYYTGKANMRSRTHNTLDGEFIEHAKLENADPRPAFLKNMIRFYFSLKNKWK
jgi:hypothetical protein